MRKTVTVQTDEITEVLSTAFDYEFTGESHFEVPEITGVPEEFNIGLIVGPSGSGKSLCLAEFGEEEQFKWNAHQAIASQFKDADDARERLSSVGLNTIPSWMRPYNVLSTGEKFRVDLAQKIKDNACIDEFTSVVDRPVAKSCSHAIQRYIRKENIKNVVFATCHYDVIEWLQPDWVFDSSTGKLNLRRGSVRPDIKLEIVPCSSEAWTIFKDHHYLSDEINKAAHCWLITWDDVLIGFAASLAFPIRYYKNAWRGHRTVVLPDYQGLGIGVRISDTIAQMHIDRGKKYFSKTAHPRMGAYRDASSLWRPTSKNHQTRTDYLKLTPEQESKYKNRLLHANRMTYSHEYIGEKDPDLQRVEQLEKFTAADLQKWMKMG